MDKEIIGIINKYEKRLDNKSEQTTYKIKYVTSYDYKKIKAWKKDLIGFYVKYYGEECKEIILEIKDIDDNYFNYYSSCDVESLLKLFAELLELVLYKGLYIRKQEILSDNDNLFNLLPLWY